MSNCQNCGQFNNGSSNFCRFCGTRVSQTQVEPPSYEYNPPRPYVWKTDEFQTSEPQVRTSRQINQVQPLLNRTTAPAQNFVQPTMPLTNYRQSPMIYAYRCPCCGTQNYPRIERKISTAGWIVFSVLLVMFFPLFWIGLLIKEDVKLCPVCNTRVG
ncbi:MAG: LITAF-like zinc ribbon domain-containing protein [Pyrinomonadaceae bacterium]